MITSNFSSSLQDDGRICFPVADHLMQRRAGGNHRIDGIFLFHAEFEQHRALGIARQCNRFMHFFAAWSQAVQERHALRRVFTKSGVSMLTAEYRFSKKNSCHWRTMPRKLLFMMAIFDIRAFLHSSGQFAAVIWKPPSPAIVQIS